MSVFVNDDLEAGRREVGPALVADAVPNLEWNNTTERADFMASLSRGRTVDELRKETGSHRVLTEREAVELVRAYGLLALHPLGGGLDPEIAWPHLRRVIDGIVPAIRQPTT